MLTFGNALKLRRGGEWIGGGGPQFSPADLSPLVWLKASTLSLSDNDAVASWTDLSGNGHHATQGTGGLQPTFKVGIVNGKAVVRFAADALALPSGLLSGLNTMCVATVIGNWSANGDGGGGFGMIAELSTNLSAFNAWSMYVNNTGTVDFGCHRTEALSLNHNLRTTPGTVASGFHALIGFADRSRGATNETALYHNGIGDSPLVQSTNMDSPFGNYATYIGGRGAASGFINADVPEIVLFDRVLSLDELGALHTYFAGEYAL